MTTPITQIIATAGQTIFDGTFNISDNTTVNAYLTPVGVTPNEINHLLSPGAYVLTYNPGNPTSFKNPRVTLNTPAVVGDIITITPSSNSQVSVDFTQSPQFSTANLNLAFQEQGVFGSYEYGLMKDRAFRYNINENAADIAVIGNRMPVMAEGGFWRRKSNVIVSQDYNSFVQEVVNDVDAAILTAVDDAFNWANRAQGSIYTDQSGNNGYSAFSGSYWANKWANYGSTVTDPQGNTGKSAKTWSEWANKWATSAATVIDPDANTGESAKTWSGWANNWANQLSPISDPDGNIGNSAQWWANVAQSAVSTAGGLIDEIYLTNSTLTTIPLVSGNPLIAWQDVNDKALSVYKNGLRLPQTGDYTFNIVAEPTVGTPSELILNTPLIVSDTLSIDRSEPQGASGMRSDGANATFPANTLLPNRNLSNVIVDGGTAVANKNLSNVVIDGGTIVANQNLSNVIIDGGTILATKGLDNIVFTPGTAVARTNLENVSSMSITNQSAYTSVPIVLSGGDTFLSVTINLTAANFNVDLFNNPKTLYSHFTVNMTVDNQLTANPGSGLLNFALTSPTGAVSNYSIYTERGGFQYTMTSSFTNFGLIAGANINVTIALVNPLAMKLVSGSISVNMDTVVFA